MNALRIVITAEQADRLQALCGSSGFSPDYQIGVMIDLDFEEWQDALASDGPSRSTRFARFAASERGSAS